MLVSIVIPCYYSEKTIAKVTEMVMEEFRKREGYACEFVLVNDGSTDGTWPEIQRLAGQYPNVRGVNLMRNFGQHNALMAGMHFAAGDYVLGMDDDMQTHPSQMFRLIQKIEDGGYDLVYGVYPVRKQSFLKNLGSKFNEVTSRILLGRPKKIKSSNYWIITRAVCREVIRYDSFNPYVDAIFYRVTHNIGNVEIEHFRREVGKSNYTLKKLALLWLSYWNFSVIPLRIAFFLGTFSAMGGVVAAICLIIHKILRPEAAMGWPSVLCVMIVLFGLILMILGIFGEYLGKIMLMQNHTPQYIIRETTGLEAQEKDS